MGEGWKDNPIGYAGDNAGLAEGMVAPVEVAAQPTLPDAGVPTLAASPAAPTSLADARSTAIILTVVGFAVAGWTFFAPRPYAMAVAMAAILPWFALVLTKRSGGVLRILPAQRQPGLKGILPGAGNPHPSAAYAFILPAMAVGFRAFQDYHLLDWQRALVMALGAAAALTVVVVFADTTVLSPSKNLFGLVVLCGFWGFGMVLEANALLDFSPATVYSTQVVEKHISYGRHTNYYVRLERWGPSALQGGEVSVSRSYYRSVEVGDAVCLPLRSGALGVRWYVLQACR